MTCSVSRPWQVKPTGFTLIELLVVITIIGILISLLIPAVQAAREAARTMQCQNNLKQIGLAIHNFATVYGGVPPQGRSDTGRRAGWVQYILPYIEQEALAKSFRDDLEWFATENQSYYRTQVSFLHCPSATHPRTSSGNTKQSVPQVFSEAGVSDYKASSGIDSSAVTGGMVSATYTRSGLWSDSVVGPFSQCTDGLSNTVMIAEDAGFPDVWIKGQRVGTVGIDAPTSASHAAYGVWAGRDNKNSVHGHTYDGMSFPGPCAINCNNWRGIYAFHPGVANVCMGDGSVQAMHEGMDIYVLFWLHTRAGGDIVTNY